MDAINTTGNTIFVYFYDFNLLIHKLIYKFKISLVGMKNQGVGAWDIFFYFIILKELLFLQVKLIIIILENSKSLFILFLELFFLKTQLHFILRPQS